MIRPVLTSALLIATAAFGTDVSNNFSNSVESILQARQYSTRSAGIIFYDLNKDSTLYALNADSSMIPASVQKVITAAMVTDLLGPAFQFETPCFVDGRFDQVSGTIHGNLIIRGCGDPGFTAENIWLLAQKLSQTGLRRITGKLLLDHSLLQADMAPAEPVSA